MNRLVFRSPEVVGTYSSGVQKNTHNQPTSREQSKLARLCQQTTSVLASILPAPFGGHERSILCQFFGNVQLDNGSLSHHNSSAGLFKKQRSPDASQKVPQHIPGVTNSVDFAIMGPESHQSVAILQQADRAPVTLLANGKHPIQLVIEQQQQQRQLYNPNIAQNQHRPFSFTDKLGPFATLSNQNDLKASASVISNVYHQRLIAPPSMTAKTTNRPHKQVHMNETAKPKVTRFSEPLVTTSVTQPSKTLGLSTRGWRGLNDSSTSIAPPMTSSTRALSEGVDFDGTSVIQKGLDGKNLTLATQLPLSTTRSEDAQRQTSVPIYQTTVAKRSETPTPDVEFATTSSRPENKQLSNDSLIRTIEVVAQVNNSTSSDTDRVNEQVRSRPEPPGSRLIALVNKTAIAPEMKHEELVIASINNLTRIAFGNQLRDTVRAINKLIDQQSGLFAKSAQDPMVVSESKASNVTVKSTIKPPEQNTKAIKSWNIGEKLKTNKSIGAGKLTFSKPPRDLTSTSALMYKYTTPSSKFYTNKPELPGRSRALSTALNNASAKISKKLAKQVSSPREKYYSGGRRNTSSRSISSTTRTQDAQYKPQKQSRSKQTGSSITSRELKRLSPYAQPEVTTKEAPRLKLDYSIDIDTDYLPSMRELHRGKAHDGGTDNTTRSQTITNQVDRFNRTRTTSAQKKPSETIETASSEFNWLLPDKSVYRTDLFETESINNERITHEKSKQATTQADQKKYTTRRTASTNAIEWTQTTAKPALILNRIEPTTKLDSLTALKMSLARQTTAAPTEPVQSSTVSTATTEASSSDWRPSTIPTTGDRKTGERDELNSGTQSRWIPTIVMNRLPPPMTTLSSPTKKIPLSPTTRSIVTTTMSTTPEPSTPMASTTIAAKTSAGSSTTSADETLATSASTQSTTKDSDIMTSQSNINEVRASDSISRYTTHWNEANEILATTRRYVAQPLPQIANTGEYFSAETISSWPEKYQAMMDRASEGTTKSGFISETTRRNGYSYEDSKSADDATLKSRADQLSGARHRVDTSIGAEMYKQTSTMAPPTMVVPVGGMFAAPLSGITVLPPNHKLTPAASTVPATNAPELDKSTDVTIQTEEETEQTDETKQTTPYQTSDSMLTTVYQPVDATVTQQQPLAVTTTSADVTKVTNASAAIVLKAPYLTETQSATVDLSDPTLVLDSGQSKPHVSRKLYEMLVPSSRTFVGSQNPLNQPKFNLSALKFLAQNLFGPINHQPANYTNETTIANSDSDTYRLLDSFSAPQGGSSSNDQLELLLNDTSLPEFEDKPQVVRNSSARGVFQRTGNLLNDLKKLEQRRAAAILAAIRYQVPSPLVRPWDLATDLFPVAGNIWPTTTTNITDRLDAIESVNRETSDLLMRDKLAAMSRAIKSALFKQRVVPRNELEARLHKGSIVSTGNEALTAERRSDPDSKYSTDLKDVDRDQYEFYSDEQDRRSNFMDRILSLVSNSTFTNRTLEADRDLDTVDLKNYTSTGFLNSNSDEHYPKYIRFADYQTAWTKGPELDGVQLYQEQLPVKQREPKSRSADFVSERTTLDQKYQWYDNAFDGPVSPSKQNKMLQEDRKQRSSVSGGFSCDAKPAGFYPDTDSACRVSTFI